MRPYGKNSGVITNIHEHTMWQQYSQVGYPICFDRHVFNISSLLYCKHKYAFSVTIQMLLKLCVAVSYLIISILSIKFRESFFKLCIVALLPCVGPVCLLVSTIQRSTPLFLLSLHSRTVMTWPEFADWIRGTCLRWLQTLQLSVDLLNIYLHSTA